MARRPVVPGAAPDAADPVTAEAPIDRRSAAMGIPDFRHQSAAAAAAWFADNPGAKKRNVLTAEGWYVHPEQSTDRRELARP